MNLMWLWLIIPPPYLVIAGYAKAFIESKGQDEDEAFPMAIIWPLTLLVLGAWHCMKIGAHLHGPERQRKRDRSIAKSEHAIYGRPMS